MHTPSKQSSSISHPGLLYQQPERPTDSSPLQAPRPDRHRLALLLEAASLLAHLDHARHHLPDSWASATVSPDGHLQAGPPRPGTTPTLPQDLLLDLVARLFDLPPGGRVAGRGEARRAARAVQRRWAQRLVRLPPDQLVADLLDEAPLLWRAEAAAARRRLAAEHHGGDGAHLWVAGPGPFRWRLLRAAGGDLTALRDLLTGDGAIAFHRGPAPSAEAAELAAAGRWRAAVRAWEEQPPRDAAGRRGYAEALLALGQGRRALAVLTVGRRAEERDSGQRASGERAAADLPLLAACRLHLGRLRSALRATDLAAAAGRSELTADQRLSLDATAVRALANGGDLEAARERAAAALSRQRGGPKRRRAHAHLIAAEAAWDGGDRPATERHLAKASVLEDDPLLAPRLHQVRALDALAGGDPESATAELSTALARHRRRLPRATAAGLWNDLGVARARRGDLAGAEKALARSLALYRGCDGPRETTLGLANLCEVRLRRGRLDGVEPILERTTAANRAAGNVRGAVHDLLLWGRSELAHGRADGALTLLRRAADRCASHGLGDGLAEARLLTARALGWLGRGEEAAAELTELEQLGGAAATVLNDLEAEERPALFAHAGRRDDALRHATGGPLERTWDAVLRGEAVPPGAWDELDGLPAFRAARSVFDLELLRPGTVPDRRRGAAVGELRRRGAVRLAQHLEARHEGPWHALAEHLARADGPDPAQLLADAGYPQARLWWESEVDARVLVPRPGGEEELRAACGDGHLVLRAPGVDATLAALLQVLRRHLEGSGAADGAAPAAGRSSTADAAAEVAPGIVGASPELARAVGRAAALAPGDLPLLVLGESGTGKELVARLVHRRSRRRDGPWVAVNCAALSESLLLSDLFGHVRGAFTGADRDRAGVFETADGGTVFLDEIGDLPAVAQGMLLRVLQEGEVRRVGESVARKVDARVVAATHRDLAAAVDGGSFRRDLYYRLKGAAVELPPLRQRGRDVLLLADHLLAGAHRRAGGGGAAPRLDEAARGRLLAHDWPGNVRELENVLAVAAVLAAADGGVLRAEHLELPGADGAADDRPAGYHQQVEALRRRLVADALSANEGNQAAAARHLGLSRQALSYLVNSLGIRTS